MSLPDQIKNLQFLVVDDYESIRVMLSEHLHLLGIHKVLSASSGNEAIKILEENKERPIEFIITDFVMENGSGLELVKAVKGNPKFKNIPILMVTSKAEVALVIECVKAGVGSYIVKPWQLEDLSKKLIDCFEKVKL